MIEDYRKRISHDKIVNKGFGRLQEFIEEKQINEEQKKMSKINSMTKIAIWSHQIYQRLGEERVQF